MTSKLCGDIAQIMYETAECGILPDTRRIICNSSGLPFHMMVHPDKERAVLIGLMTDMDDVEHVKAFKIDFNKWNWASTEGFDLKSIFAGNLYLEIFEEIPPHKVSSYFVR